MKRAIWIFAVCALLLLTATACGMTGSSTYTGNDNDIFGDADAGSGNNTGANLSPGANTSVSGAGAAVRPSRPSYQQMLENARVHDSDGILTDGENACSG